MTTLRWGWWTVYFHFLNKSLMAVFLACMCREGKSHNEKQKQRGSAGGNADAWWDLVHSMIWSFQLDCSHSSVLKLRRRIRGFENAGENNSSSLGAVRRHLSASHCAESQCRVNATLTPTEVRYAGRPCIRLDFYCTQIPAACKVRRSVFAQLSAAR